MNLAGLGEASDADRQIAESIVYPFTLPYHRALDEIRQALIKQNTSLASIYAMFGVGSRDDALIAESLSMSLWEYIIIEGRPENIAFVNDEIQINVVFNGEIQAFRLTDFFGGKTLSQLQNIDTFLAATGLTYIELQDLFEDRFSSAQLVGDESLSTLFINSNTVDANSVVRPIRLDISNNRLLNLEDSDAIRVDEFLQRIHRVIRLAKRTGLSFPDLNKLINVGVGVNVEAINLRVIASYLSVKQQLDMSSDEFIGIVGNELNNVATADSLGFFRQVYRKLIETNNTIVLPSSDVSWQIDGTDQIATQLRLGLQSSLQVEEQLLISMARAVLSANAVDGVSFVLSLPNLTVLYRIVAVARLNQVGVQYLLDFVRNLGSSVESGLLAVNATVDERLDALETISQSVLSLRRANIDEPTLDSFLNINASTDADVDNRLNNLISELLIAERALLLTTDDFINFARTDSSGTPADADSSEMADASGNISSTQIFNLLNDNNYIDHGVVINSRLGDDILSGLDERNRRALKDFLNNHMTQQIAVFVGKVADDINLSEAIGEELIIWVGNLLSTNDNDIVSENATEEAKSIADKRTIVNLLRDLLVVSLAREAGDSFEAATRDREVQIIRSLSYHGLLISRFNLQPVEISAIRYIPAAFGLEQNTPLNLEQIFNLATYEQLIKQLNDDSYGLVNYLLSTNSATDSTEQRENAASLLASIFNRDATQVRLAIDSLWSDIIAMGSVPYNTLAGLYRMYRLFIIADQLQVSIPTVVALYNLRTATSYDSIASVATSLLAQVRASFSETSESRQLTSLLLERRRNALLPLALHRSASLNLNSVKDINQYLCIDVLSGGDIDTSLIVEAINALQLYINQVRMGLEPNVRTTAELEAFWEFSSNYRVWQANREVFFYPENYLDPNIRLGKTELMESFENGLQEADLNEETVETAFRSYVDDFALLSSLRFSGGYNYTQNDPEDGYVTDVFVLIGRTHIRPYQHYLRTMTFRRNIATNAISGSDYGNWSKISLTIDSPMVCPCFAYGKLFLFWVAVDVQTASNSSTSTNAPSARLEGGIVTTANPAPLNRFRGRVNFSYQNTDGSWSSAQPIGSYASLVVGDPGNPNEELTRAIAVIEQTETTRFRSMVAFAPQVAINAQFSEQILIAHQNLELRISGYLNDQLEYTEFRPSFPRRSDRSDIFHVASIADLRLSAFDYGRPLPQSDLDDSNNNAPDLFNSGPSGELIRIPGERSSVFVYASNQTSYVVVDQHAFRFASTAGPQLSEMLMRGGVKELLSVSTQQIAEDPYADRFRSEIAFPRPPSGLDFNGVNGIYYWELFFYAPSLVAQHLNQGQMFEQAQTWYEYIFNPRTDALLDLGRIPIREIDGQVFYINENVVGDMITTLTAAQVSDDDRSQVLRTLAESTAGRTADASYSLTQINSLGSATASTPQTLTEFLSNSGSLRSGDGNREQSNVVHKISGTLFLRAGRNVYITDHIYGMGLVLNIVGLSNPLQRMVYNTSNGPNIIEFNVPRDNVYAIDIYYFKGAENGSALSVVSRVDVQNNPFDIIVVDSLLSRQDANGLREISGVLSVATVEEQKRSLVEIGVVNAVGSVHQPELYWQFLPFREIAPIETIGSVYFNVGLDMASTVPYDEQRSADLIYRVKQLSFGDISSGTVSISQFLNTESDHVEILSGSSSENHERAVHRIIGSLVLNQGNHTIRLYHDTGVRFYINDNMLIDDLVNGGSRYSVAQFGAERSGIHSFELLYYQNTGVSTLDMEIAVGIITEGIDVTGRSIERQADNRFKVFSPLPPYAQRQLQTIFSLLDSAQVNRYIDSPFDPHAIARLRRLSYKRATFNRYIDNLIDYGDRFYRQVTRENISEAEIIYIEVQRWLGDFPVQIRDINLPADNTLANLFNTGPIDINADGDVNLTDADIVATELPSSADPQISRALGLVIEQRVGMSVQNMSGALSMNNFLVNRYFAIPVNPQLLSRWELVGRRLNNIRNSLDIDGNPLNLALFAPPIDPRGLIAGRARGESLNQLVNGIPMPVPHYRFSVVIEQAKALVATVSQFGQLLQTALQNRDVATLESMRASHERALLETSRGVIREQLRASSGAVFSLINAYSGAYNRLQYYTQLVDGTLPETGQPPASFLPMLSTQPATLVSQAEPTVNELADQILGSLGVGDNEAVSNIIREALSGGIQFGLDLISGTFDQLISGLFSGSIDSDPSWLSKEVTALSFDQSAIIAHGVAATSNGVAIPLFAASTFIAGFSDGVLGLGFATQALGGASSSASAALSGRGASSFYYCQLQASFARLDAATQ